MHAIFTGHELSDKVIKFETDRGHNICKYHLTATQKDEADRRLQEIHTCACITMVFGFADVTFKVVPTIFFQLWTIHAMYESHTVPLVYALLTNKTQVSGGVPNPCSGKFPM